MESGRFINKELTSVHQSGVTSSGSPTTVGAMMQSLTVQSASQNPHMLGEDDSHRTLTGPNMGGFAAGSAQHAQKWGHVTPSGSRMEVDDTAGAESIHIVHHSGAGVTVEPDGGVFINSTSRRGAGIGAPRGDIYIAAGGEIVIDGPGTISIQTAGDLNLVVGGMLNIVAGGIKVTTKALEETIDGYATRSVTNDQSVIVGGINRSTVAGDQRVQVSGSNILDVGGNDTIKVKGNRDTNVTGDSTQQVKGKSSNHSTGDMAHVTDGELSVSSKGDAAITSDGDLTQSSSGAMKVTSDGAFVAGGKSSTKVSSDGDIRLSGSTAELSSQGETVVSGSSAAIGGSVVRLATGTVQGPIPAGAGGSVSAFKDSVPDAGDASDATEAKEADFPEANDVVDSLTTVRKHPEYPGNGRLESAYATNTRQVSYDNDSSADAVYGEVTGQNKGNFNPSTIGGSIDTLPDQPIDRDPNIQAVNPNINVPARNDNSAKISKYFTLGMLTRAPLSDSIPQDQWQSVVGNHILLAYNCLDQIREKFPDIIITSAYRASGANHPTGRAVDIVVPSRSATRHAEIARFARDNLPVEKVLLERNDSGRTHVHIQVTESGIKNSSPTILTCADKRCAISTPGINLEWLQRNA
ncbi:baseplate hub subunit and tail lysozyme protein [Rhizobium phage RHph_I1_18]|nr:baseplate hub subunit and tail lysozyme protein [Rhizobium phage RHph_I1_18]